MTLVRLVYGRGFWFLGFGIMVAASAIIQMESGRSRPVVERIPASEVAVYTK